VISARSTNDGGHFPHRYRSTPGKRRPASSAIFHTLRISLTPAFAAADGDDRRAAAASQPLAVQFDYIDTEQAAEKLLEPILEPALRDAKRLEAEGRMKEAAEVMADALTRGATRATG
jgi:hypothetical protein